MAETLAADCLVENQPYHVRSQHEKICIISNHNHRVIWVYKLYSFLNNHQVCIFLTLEDHYSLALQVVFQYANKSVFVQRVRQEYRFLAW